MGAWEVLKSNDTESYQEKGNRIIINLLNLGLSQIEIRQTLICGGRVDRMRNRINAGSDFIEPERKPCS